MLKTLSVTEARNNLLQLVKQSNNLLSQTIITKNGKPEAVLMSFDEYESWVETLEIAGNKKLMKEIREARKQSKSKKLHSLEDLLNK